jgi:hypothetical protein
MQGHAHRTFNGGHLPGRGALESFWDGVDIGLHLASRLVLAAVVVVFLEIKLWSKALMIWRLLHGAFWKQSICEVCNI